VQDANNNSARASDIDEMFVRRVQKNIRRLRPWVSSESISCYRIYDRDIPECPVTVDWYEGRLHAAFYARGESDSSRTSVKRWMAVLAAQLKVPRHLVFLKRRERHPSKQQYNPVARKKAEFVVSEANLKFKVNLSDYIDTGLFLDHRRTRGFVRSDAKGKRVLNLFGYTGAFSVYAAAGKARSSTYVDLSNTYLDWAVANMELNQLRKRDYVFVKDDVFSFLKNHRPQHEGYELVVVDPPTISRSKAMSGKFDIQRDHPFILKRVLDLCCKGGIIYFSTNFRKFKPRWDEIGCSSTEDISESTLPRDFRDKKIHRCYRMIK